MALNILWYWSHATDLSDSADHVKAWLECIFDYMTFTLYDNINYGQEVASHRELIELCQMLPYFRKIVLSHMFIIFQPNQHRCVCHHWTIFQLSGTIIIKIISYGGIIYPWADTHFFGHQKNR